MDSDKYVTIVPVEYPRNKQQFIRPPDEYRWYSHAILFNRRNVFDLDVLFSLAIFLKTGIGPTPEPCGPTPIPVREGKNWKDHWNRKGRTVIPIPIQYNRAPSR